MYDTRARARARVHIYTEVQQRCEQVLLMALFGTCWQCGQNGDQNMVEYDSFKKQFMDDCKEGKTEQDCSVIATLKKNAYLVDIIHDAKGLAEDIYANACEIERTYQTDCWPKFEEDGEPVKIGDMVYGLHGKEIVDSIEVSSDGWRLYGRNLPKQNDDGSITREKFIINEGRRFDYAHKTYEYAQSYVIHDDKERM